MDIIEIWDRIERWLADHAPAILAGLASGATEAEIQIMELICGISLPDDIRMSCKRHNGQETKMLSHSIFGAWKLLSLREIVDAWQFEMDLYTAG